MANNDMALSVPCHYLDDFHNTDFSIPLSGRQDAFKCIDEAFFPSEPPRLTVGDGIGDGFHSTSPPLKVFTLHGSEGIGKSRVAAEYVNRRKDKFPVILWIDAASEDKIYSAYRSFAEQLGLSSESDRTEPDPVIKNIVHKWFSSPFNCGSMIPWLIVMDAVATDVLGDFWPPNGRGSILLTTRKPSLAKTFGTAEAALEPLSVPEGAEMLLNLTKQRNEPDAELYAKQIAKFWKGIPGCMELVDGVMRTKHSSLAEFAATQQAKKDDYLLVNGLSGVKKPTDAFGVMSWLTIEALEAHKGGELELLLVLAFLDGSRVQERILMACPMGAVWDNYPTKEDVYLECRKSLLEASVIKYDPLTKSLRLSNTMQDTMLLRMKEKTEQLSSGLFTAATLVLSQWPRTITAETSFSDVKMDERWSECGCLIPHVNRIKNVYLAMTEADRKQCATREFTHLLAEAAWFQSEKANATACQTLVDLGLSIYNDAEPSKQKAMLDIYAALHNTKGGVLARINKPHEALQHMKYFLDAQQRLCSAAGGGPSGKLAAAYSELALAHLACGNTDKVLPLLMESTTIRRGLPTFNPTDLYNPLRYEGLYHIHERDWPEAKRCFLKALQDRQDRYGVDDVRGPRAGIVLYNLGDLYRLQGEWKESCHYHVRAYKSLKWAVGETHLTTLRAEYKVALYIFENKVVEDKDAEYLSSAEEILKHCLTAYESHDFVEGETARARFLLGKVMQMTGNAWAETCLKKAMKDRQKLLGRTDEHPLQMVTIRSFDAIVPYGAR